MKLYYFVNKWTVDKTNIFLPLYYPPDVRDIEYMQHATLRVFREDQLISGNLFEQYDELKPVHEYKQLGRVISIYSIELADIPNNFTVEHKRFWSVMSIINTKDSWENINENQSYNKHFASLKWKLESNIVLNTNNLKATLTNLPDDPYNDLNRLINVICAGDHPDRLVRLNILQKMWSEESDVESARELYDILYDFTFGDFYDINSDGTSYYREMRYLRDRYNVDPERSKSDGPITYFY